MTCHEAREQFTALVDEALRAEERATLDAHLAECAECRRELAGFQRAVGLVRAIEPARAPGGFVDRVAAAARPAPWSARLARRLVVPWTRLPVQAAAVVVLAGLAVLIYRGSVEQQKAVRQEAAPPAAVAPAPTTPAAPPSAQDVLSPSTPPSAVTPPPPPAVAAPAEAPVAAPASPPAQPESANKRARLDDATADRKERPDQQARSIDESERPMAKSRRDAAPATPQDKPKAEPLRDADGAAAERSASGRASEPRAQSAPLSRTGPDTGRKPGRVPDVVAALTPADVETAERQLIVLATQHGGAQAGRRVDAGGVTVELDIPRERYADFARAAATLGSFSAPAATSVAAPMVRVDVRLDAPR